MGCFHSKTSNVQSPEDDSPPADKRDLPNGDGGDQDQVPSFKEYGLAELRAATKEFSPKLIVSESGEKAPNVVYQGKLDGGRLVAVKRFSKQSWPDAQQFVAEAAGVGKVRHKRLVNLIGCCAEGDERLLVAEFMPNDTLSKHLFHCIELYLSYLVFLFLFSKFELFLWISFSSSVFKPSCTKRKQEDGLVLFWKNEIVDGWGGNLIRDNG